MLAHSTEPPISLITAPAGFRGRLQEVAMFLDGTDRIHATMRRVANALEEAGIAYAVVGGMAVNAHRHQRTTGDVDFLLSAAGLASLRAIAAAHQFAPTPGRPRRFTDLTSGVTFDILIAGQFPGSGEPGPIAFPDPGDVSQPMDDVRVVNLPTLVQLKLAAGRYQDFADVVSLIRANGLDDSFMQSLHPSLRPDFSECIEEMRREDQYEARMDRDADGAG